MKKLVAALLAVCMMFTLTACTKPTPGPDPDPTPTTKDRQVVAGANNFFTDSYADTIGEKSIYKAYGIGATAGASDAVNDAAIAKAVANANTRFKTLIQGELVKLLQTKGTFVIMFGGAWCGNTTPIMPYVNAWAESQGIETIYMFDNYLDGSYADGAEWVAEYGVASDNGGKNTKRTTHIRDTNSALSYLYGEYMTYLANATSTNGNVSAPVLDKDGNVTSVKDHAKLSVPAIVVYDSENVVAAAQALTNKSAGFDPKGNADGNFQSAMPAVGGKAPVLAKLELAYSWTQLKDVASVQSKSVMNGLKALENVLSYKAYTAADKKAADDAANAKLPVGADKVGDPSVVIGAINKAKRGVSTFNYFTNSSATPAHYKVTNLDAAVSEYTDATTFVNKVPATIATEMTAASVDQKTTDMHLIAETGLDAGSAAVQSIFQTVTYEELRYLMDQPGEFFILFGGEWCPNTQAMGRHLAELGVARKYIPKIYVFDTRLDGKTGSLNIRGAYTPYNTAADAPVVEKFSTNYVNLYVDLMKAMPNFYTRVNVGNAQVTIPGKGADGNAWGGARVTYERMSVPTFMLYNSDRAEAPVIAWYGIEYYWDATFAAPVVGGDKTLFGHTTGFVMSAGFNSVFFASERGKVIQVAA